MNGATLWVLGMLTCTAIAIAPLPSSEMVDPESTRARSMRRAELRLTAAVAAFSVCAVAATWSLARGHVAAIVPIAIGFCVTLLVIHPWVLVRHIAIRFAMPRLAWALARMGGHPWVRDPEGGAVLAGALAALRRRKHDPEIATWLHDKLRGTRLRGAGLAAAGLLAADAGDRDRARALLGSIDQLDPDLCPPLARAIALDWLVADDACAGRWDAVATTPDDVPIASRTARFFAVAARRLSSAAEHGEAWPSDRTLLRRWLAAPRRLATVPLLSRALRADASRSEASWSAIDPRFIAVLPANDGGACHVEAVSLHREALVEPDAGDAATTRIERLARAWDQAFAGFDLRRHIRERTNALEGSELGELATAKLQRDVASDVAQMMGRADVTDLGTQARPRSILARARQTLADERLDALFEACAIAQVRRRPIQVPNALEAWIEVLAIETRYEALAKLLDREDRRQAFAMVEIELRQTAAWFWNDLAERGLANAVSTWLLLEAERVHDSESAAYHRRNIALVV